MTGFLFTYHSAIPENFLKEYFFSGVVDFGLPFSIDLLSSSAFLSFRKALEQDAMPCANGCNTVCQQLPTMLRVVASVCTPRCMLLEQ